MTTNTDPKSALHIEPGKLYRTRDGRKVFCGDVDEKGLAYMLIKGEEHVFCVGSETGRSSTVREYSDDTISEWSDP